MKTLFTFFMPLMMYATSCGTITSPAPTCSVGDKDFTNVNFLGNVPAQGSIDVTEVVPNRVYVVDLSGLFLNSFAWIYDVSVNTSICPNCKITHVGYGITGLPSPAPTLQSTFNSFVGPSTDGNAFGPVTPTTSLHVVNTFNPNGGFATRISNTILETIQQVNEPPALALVPPVLLLAVLTKKYTQKKGV